MVLIVIGDDELFEVQRPDVVKVGRRPPVCSTVVSGVDQDVRAGIGRHESTATVFHVENLDFHVAVALKVSKSRCG